jgi:hypothetical protein
MKSNRRNFMAAVCCGLSMQVASVVAAPIGGSATIPFSNGGTLSGFFEINVASGGIVSWDLTSTAFGTHVYDEAIAGASSLVTSNSNGNQVLSFFQVFPDGAVQSTFELDIVLDCDGVPNCLRSAKENIAFAVVGGFVPCLPGQTLCVSSGEQRPNGFGQHFLTGGFVNVTDPPQTLAFNVDSTIAPGFTLFNGRVPEPPTLLLVIMGIAFGMREIVKRREMERA